MTNNNQQAFFALVRAGLWSDGNLDIQIDETTDWNEVYQLAQEQSVQGLVLAGLEYSDIKPPKILLLQWIGEVQLIEQRNKTMNGFIADLLNNLRKEDVYCLLVKGQGVAQCYEKPLWRSSGDIDFLLSKDNYGKVVTFFKNKYSNNKDGGRYSQEYAFYTDQWMIEVHGTLRTCLSSRIDKVVDTVQKSVFYGGNVRSWENNGTLVFLPAPTEDVFLVFTHFIKHFYKEGMTLRQVCDWCRLLYTFRDSLYYGTLEQRIKSAGLMNEWNAFAAFAVEYLGMPIEAIPLYSKAEKWSRKAEKIVDFILKGGEWRKWKDTYRVGRIFPMSTLKFFPGIILNVNWLKIKERVLKA